MKQKNKTETAVFNTVIDGTLSFFFKALLIN